MANAEGLPGTGPGAIAVMAVKLSSSSAPGARTTLWFREARWYTDLSVRQNPLGDNAIFQAGSVIPAEDGGIVFSLDSPHGQPGGSVTTSLRISPPVGVARMEGFLAFDADTLLFPSLSVAPSLSGWSEEVQYGVGQIHFILTGPTELSGADPIQIASCTWALSQQAVPGSETVIAASDPQSKNLQDFRYVSLNQSGKVLIDSPAPTPTPGPLLVKDWISYWSGWCNGMLMDTKPLSIQPFALAISLRVGLVSLLCVLISSNCRAQDRVFSLMDSAALPGTQLQVEIRLSELQGFAGGDFTLGFDTTVVSVLDVNKTPVTSDFLVSYGVSPTGRVSISMAAGEGLAMSGAGTIATLELQVAGNAASGTLSVLSVRTARWYDELSVRHTLFGDNNLLAIDAAAPANEPLTLAIGDEGGHAGNVVNLPLTISMGHSAGKVSGDITFNPVLLSFVDLQLSSSFAGWASQLLTGAGTLHFLLTGSTECVDPHNVVIGTVSFTIAESVEPGTTEVGMTGTTISNLEGLSYSHLSSGGTLQVSGPEEPTPSLTLTPSATPTLTPVIDELHPADFNGDSTVDQTDLLLFLEIWRQEVTRPWNNTHLPDW
jgi:hypothetical protein